MTKENLQKPGDIGGARRSLWRARGRRLVFRANTAMALVFAGALLVFVNVLAQRYYNRWNIGDTDFARLSPKTLKMMESISGQLRIVAFLERSNDMYQEFRSILESYSDAARSMPDLKLQLEFVDPDRDLARTRELSQAMGLSEPNVVVFEYAGRRKYIGEADMLDYQRTVEYEKLLSGQPSVRRRLVAFRGEQVFSSAIQSVVHEARPKVLMITGHGERGADDHSDNCGYSEIARTIRRDNVELASIGPAGLQSLSADGSALVIAGPTHSYSENEAAAVGSYLEHGGRLLMLVDQGVTTGLERMLAAWGVRPGLGVAVGPSLTGKELIVAAYGNHEIARPMRDVVTMFYGPGPLETDVKSSGSAVDRPCATILASNGAQGWVETDPSQDPPRYDPDKDRRGPAAVAVAVERGSPRDMALGIRPTRIVVLSGSDFVSNGALRTGVSGNRDFFMSALNWLLEREELMDIAPRAPGELRLDMSRKQVLRTYLVLLAAVPGALALLGYAVVRQRR